MGASGGGGGGGGGGDVEAEGPIVGESYCSTLERYLTVRKTSVFYHGDGFAVYDHHNNHPHPFSTNDDGDKVAEHEEAGEILFRVETYGPGPNHTATDELVLMDPDGYCILTVRRKRPSLHQRWEGFMGERKEGQRPLFSVRRSSMIRRDSGGAGIVVEVCDDRELEYLLEGSFPQRCCTVHRCSGGVEGKVVADIRRKVDANAVMGRDVFCLRIKPGFDAAFAMGLVLILDQITSEADGDSRAAGKDEDESSI